MIAKMYSVYDAKAGSFAQPFFSQNEALAIRAVSAVMQDERHTFWMHSEDYSVYLLGEWDDETGRIEAIQPVVIATLTQIKQSYLTTGMEIAVNA